MRAQDQLIAGNFHIFDSTSTIAVDGIHIGLAFSIGLERVVVAIDENGGAGQKPRIHAHALTAINLDGDKAFPALAGDPAFRAEAAQENLFELQHVLYVHAHDEGFSGGDSTLDQEDILKFVFGRRQDAGAFVDFGRIDKIEDREMLHLENSIHAFYAEATFTIEEVGDMSLSKASLRGQTEASQFSLSDTLPQSLTKIVLESLEFHVPSLPVVYSMMLLLIIKRTSHNENTQPSTDTDTGFSSKRP